MKNKIRLPLILSIALALGWWAFLLLLGSLATPGTGFYRLIEVLGGTGNGYIQALIYALFFYSVLQLIERRRFLRGQYRGFQLQLLPTRDQLVLTPDEVNQIKLQTIELERAGQSLLVADFIKKACTQYRNDQSISETLQVFHAQVDTSKEEMEGQLEMVRYLVGAVVSVGFIGTLIGLSSSIGLAHLAQTTEGMPLITRQLNVAFDTTLVALLVGLVLNFFYHRYLAELDTFYSRSKSYVIDNLISRIYNPTA
jgi:chemotaxis protein MotA